MADYMRNITTIDPSHIKSSEEANTFRLQIIPHRREGRATDVLR